MSRSVFQSQAGSESPRAMSTSHHCPGPAVSFRSPHRDTMSYAACKSGDPRSALSHLFGFHCVPTGSRFLFLWPGLPWSHNPCLKTGIALFALRRCKCPHRPHHLPGKSWLISSISSTISYGTPASASSTLSWPGILPATGWIPNLDRKHTNGWPHFVGQSAQRPQHHLPICTVCSWHLCLSWYYLISTGRNRISPDVRSIYKCWSWRFIAPYTQTRTPLRKISVTLEPDSSIQVLSTMNFQQY